MGQFPKDIERRIRLEKADPSESLDPDYVQVSSAKVKYDRAQNRAASNEARNMPNAAKVARAEAAKFSRNLQVAEDPENESNIKKLRGLMEVHAKSNASSPFLSVTSRFTVGKGSQAYHFDTRASGKYASISIINTSRSLLNPFNSREEEYLLPTGVQRRELAGTLTRTEDDYTYTDFSGDDPVIHRGDRALEKFNLEARSTYRRPT
ncbi:hypothetical protein [Burkholderia plantarii]|uniref:hypothetical protein n=1 Tax=Burkholderia plantarii TaxID=41899 RepID=UPI0011DF929C|nr:hypothetical protein [Burkholderia plantarii]GLZ23118.1 hypothetical protein Bpla01_66460 [Burkholderia plantarii]